MIANIVSVKNATNLTKTIRPYNVRTRTVTFKPGDQKELNLRECNYDALKNPLAYFKALGLQLVRELEKKTVLPEKQEKKTEVVNPPEIKLVNQHEVKRSETAAPAAPTTVNPPLPTSPTVPAATAVETPAATVPNTSYTLNPEFVKFKQYNSEVKAWQGVRKVKDYLVGRVLYVEDTKAYLKCTRVNNGSAIGSLISESDALAITGEKAN